MVIGVLTYHRTNNYGACLQAVATRIVLERMGHSVYYVDYWPKYHKRKYSLFSFSKLFFYLDWKGRYKYVRNFFKYYSLKRRRIQNFNNFLKEYIYPFCRSEKEIYDVVIYGSDQIWRKQSETKLYNPIYFGKNSYKTNRHISYAASMGILPSKKEDIETIKELMTHLNRISVRENDLKVFLEGLGFSSHLSLDPTLLLDSETWDKLIPSSEYNGEKYILVYTMGANGFDMRQVHLFAKKKQLRIITLKGSASSEETDTNIVTANPVVFLRLMKNAEYVFCSSFHGLAFSIIYHKQVFASFVRNEGRARSLLSILGIEERLLPPKSSIPELEDIRYEEVERSLQEQRTDSMEYLCNALKD